MIRKTLSILFSAEAAVAVTCYLIIATLMLTDVLLRETVGTSIWAAQRVSVYLMIVTGFLGLGLAASRGRHLRPQFADGLVPVRFTRIARRIGSAIMAATFFVFAVFAIEFVIQSYEYEDMTRGIKIPLWIVELIVPYAFFTTGLRYAIFAIFPELNPVESKDT